MERKASLKRKTRETDISLDLQIDGTGKLEGDIPIPFFAHMLDHLTKYSLFDLNFTIKGDIEIDGHHTVEDSAIVLGEAIKQALGDKKGIFRYGWSMVTMDEVLTRVAVDFSGRPFFNYKGPDLGKMGLLGSYESELTAEFLQKLSIHASMNLHVIVEYGENRHHIHESIFKALGFALRNGAQLDPRRGENVPSTKGSL